MGRAKLKMELITKEKTRNTTYQKRKQGIIKKAKEFTILCDVDTVIIIYPPTSDQPEIWPENPDQVKKTIASYKAKKSENGKKSYDLNDFFEDRKKKIEDELVKARKKNMEAKYSTWFDELDGLSEMQLRQFAMRLEEKENLVRDHLEFKKRSIVNMQMPFRFDHLQNMVQPPFSHYSHPGLEQVQMVNTIMNQHDVGWFNDAPGTSSYIPFKREPMVAGYEYGTNYVPFEGGMAYDNLNPWVYQAPMIQCGLIPEFAMQEQHPQVGNENHCEGVGEFLMPEQRGRFLGC